MAKTDSEPECDMDDALAGTPLVSNVTAARMLGIERDSLRSVAKGQLAKGIVMRVPPRLISGSFDRRTAVYYRSAIEFYRATRGEPVGRPRRQADTDPGQ